MAGGRQTSGFSSVPFRLEQVEDHVREQRELNAKLNEGLWALRATMEKGLGALSDRIKQHDESRDMWRKIVIAVLSALALGLVGFLLKISVMVQGARLPPP